MSPKGRGGGRTPEKLVELLNKAVENKVSVRALSRDTGLGLAPISRYLKGTSEPSQGSLEKLAVYFGTSVAYLRGEPERGSTRRAANEDADLLFEQLKGLLEIYRIIPERLTGVVLLVLTTYRDAAAESLEFHGPNMSEERIEEMHKLMDEIDYLR